MKTFNLGKISGENGESVTIKMGEAIFVDVPEEAGAEFLREGNEYTLNLKIPKPIGGGDMKMAVYDKEGIGCDLFEYINKNTLTKDGGEFTGPVILNEAPTREMQAAPKKFVNDEDDKIYKTIKNLVEKINDSQFMIYRDGNGAPQYEEIATPIENITITKDTKTKDGENIKYKEWYEVAEFTVEGVHHHINFKLDKVSTNAESDYGQYTYYDKFKIIGVEEDGETEKEYAWNTYHICETPKNFKLMHYPMWVSGKRDAYQVTINSLKVFCEKRNKISLEELEGINGDSK